MVQQEAPRHCRGALRMVIVAFVRLGLLRSFALG